MPDFGAAGGDTIMIMAERTLGPVCEFDPFGELPETWRSDYGRGTFALARLPRRQATSRRWAG